jgi:hypothetical protein
MILNKDVLVNNIATELSDNSTGQISPYDIRHNLLDIIDSVHLLTKGFPLDGSNFSTRATRTTRVGEEALSKIELAGYFSIDNTAVGHSSLKGNYQGIKNTAIGSHALFCNVYGENNAALGYSALGGNTVGHANVGLGSFTLNNNKGGNFNIAIGQGAGYYAKDVSNKLFIASHNVDSNFICDNPLGSGLTPLVYGDLQELRFGIGVNNLHAEATLQVSGNISPSTASGQINNLGSNTYKWTSLYLSNKIYLDSDLYIGKLDSSNIELRGGLLPQTNSTYGLGSSQKSWGAGYFDNIYVNGLATINRFTAIENCSYFCKTINLASSGNINLDGGGPNTLYDYSYADLPSPYCGYLQDSELNGAGIKIQASGVGYTREYSLLFSPPNSGLSCLEQDTPYSRASWNSNISINLNSGTHLSTDRIIFPSSINIVNSVGCFGIFSRSSGIYFSKNNLISSSANPSGYLTGVGDVNFYSALSSTNDYIVNFAAPESGVIIKQRFLNGIKTKATDPLNNNKDLLNGFEIQSIDDSINYTFGPNADRLVIGSYLNSSKPLQALTLMKSEAGEGIVGITNLSPNIENVLPATSLNIRSSNNAIGRFTAENDAGTISAIQLLGGKNCLENGFEAAYINSSGLADISLYIDSGKSIFFRLYDNKTLGLFTSSGTTPTTKDMFTMGDAFNDNALISMYENNQTISSRPNHAKIYVKEKIRSKQRHTVYVTDDGGNLHDLIVNPFDAMDGRGLYTDPSGNTFGGLYCPKQRDNLLAGVFRNTAIGSGALFNISTGDDNSVFGAASASGLTGGVRNSIVGSNSANAITNGNDNIVFGHNSFRNSSPASSNNIIIGNSIGSGINTSNNIVVGQSNVTLLEGKLGPNNIDKYLSMPSGGRFFVSDSTNTDSLQLRANYIDVFDRGGGDYPNNSLTITFNGNESAELFRLNHSSEPMTNTATYRSSIPSRPYGELLGDFRVRGAIRFSDFTSLESASFLNNINVLESGLLNANNAINYINQSFVEGYVEQKINAPLSPQLPTVGVLSIKDKNWLDLGKVTLVNRDLTTSIHAGAYVIAIRINDEYRPLWISASDTKCQCCR